MSDEVEPRQMTAGQLKDNCRGVFGEDTPSRHKQFPFRRVPADA